MGLGSSGSASGVDYITMERAVFVYTTYPSAVEAEKAGAAMVDQRLAACVNILPGMISHYWWEGKVERGEETVMILKTRASLAGPSQRRGEGEPPLHDAGDLVLPIESVEPTYLRWLLAETAQAITP